VIDALSRLKSEGKIERAGFSTHHRDIAAAAIARGGWDVVMTRHSAAHPGAEREVFPAADERGVGVITFSALSYGRLLREAPGAPGKPAFTAADCYRYSMKQRGVLATIAAPRSSKELEHDLEVLARPSLPTETERALLEHGARVRAVSRFFNDFVRMPRSGALFSSDALPEILLEETGAETWARAPGAGSASRGAR
jgi:predicted aldo/keto reductase-like oxidoreductase